MENSQTLQKTYYDSFDYDSVVSKYRAVHHKKLIPSLLTELLYGLKGTCLDVGCGTGINGPTLRKLGFHVVGTDISANQIKIAREKKRLHEVVQADAQNLPFPDASFDVVISSYTHTDMDDWDKVIKEISRVLKPDGHFVYVGAHLCFFGAHSKRQSDGKIIIYPGFYHNTNRVFQAPGFSKNGVREHVGARHLSQERFFNAILKNDLHLDGIREDKADLPEYFGIRTYKSKTSPSKEISQTDNKLLLTVFCGSSEQVNKRFLNLAKTIGKKAGETGYDIVYGGSQLGMMGEMARAAQKADAKVYGITTPEMLLWEKDKTFAHEQLVITKSMAARKEEMLKRGDAFLILPGGLGTIDELLEVITLQGIDLLEKQVVILNFEEYYNGLFIWINELIRKKFVNKNAIKFTVTKTIEEAFQAFQHKTPNPAKAVIASE